MHFFNGLLDKLGGVVVSQALLDQLRGDAHELQGRLQEEQRGRYESIEESLQGAATVDIQKEYPRKQMPEAWPEEYGWMTAADLWHAEQVEGMVLDDISDSLPAGRLLRTNQLLQCMHRQGWLPRSELDAALAQLDEWPSHRKGNVDAPLVVRAGRIATPIVLSMNAIDSLERLGVLAPVVDHCARLVVSSPTWGHFASDLAQLRFFGRMKERHDRLRQQAATLPTIRTVEAEAAAGGLDSGIQPPFARHNWFLVREGQRLLWTDDAVIFAYTEKMPVLRGARPVTTLAVLRWLRDAGHIDEDGYRKRVLHLVSLRYEYIVLLTFASDKETPPVQKTPCLLHFWQSCPFLLTCKGQ